MIWALIAIAILAIALFAVLILWSVTGMALVRAETELRILKEDYAEENTFDMLSNDQCGCQQCESQQIVRSQMRND
jgi:hypothetical protein